MENKQKMHEEITEMYQYGITLLQNLQGYFNEKNIAITELRQNLKSKTEECVTMHSEVTQMRTERDRYQQTAEERQQSIATLGSQKSAVETELHAEKENIKKLKENFSALCASMRGTLDQYMLSNK